MDDTGERGAACVMGGWMSRTGEDREGDTLAVGRYSTLEDYRKKN